MMEIYILDCHSLIYRSFFAFIRNPLRNSKGMNTSAIFGFVNTLKKLMKERELQYGACAFDSGRSFRQEAFKEYKAQRPKTPDELLPQIEIIREVVEGLGFPIFEVLGYEADDVISSLVQRLKGMGKIYIVSSDKDLFQLIDDQVFVYDPWREIVFDREKVIERFGVPPERISDILALAGDLIDNIPGIPGIGEKRAMEIIRKFSSLEEALEKDERIKPYKELAQLGKKLTILETNLFDEVPLESLKLKEKNQAKLLTIFKELEFSSFLKDIAREKLEVRDQKVVELDERLLENSRAFAFHYDCREGLFLTFDSSEVVRIPISESARISQVLGSKDHLKIGFDIKNQRLGTIVAPIFDLKIASYLLDPNRKRYDFSDLLLSHLQILLSDLTPWETARYGLELYKKIEPEIIARSEEELFYNIEMPLIFVLAEMEARGIKIDVSFFSKFTRELDSELNILEKKVKEEAGLNFNLNSPQQLAYVLFDKLRLSPKKRTKTGFSTDSQVLYELSSEHPIINKILRYRELKRLKSTYLEPMLELVENKGHRIHPTFNQTGTATGRLSCEKPNLQNIPIRGELGRKIRNGFIAEDGYLLISADYSQIELRILAHLTKDKRLIAAFERDEDIHTQTACAILKLKECEVTEEARRIAKIVNYGILYGMSDYGLSEGLKIPIEEARSFIEEYLLTYRQVAEWRERIIEEAKEQGFVKTIAGRIRPLPGIFAKNRLLYEATERMALNSPVQGSAADVIKKAMVLVSEQLRKANISGGIVLQVHDELLFEIEEKRIDETKELIRATMEEIGRDFKPALTVPLKVSIGVGKNWGEIVY